MARRHFSPRNGGLLLQIVVPEDATLEDVRRWSTEVYEDFSGSDEIFINWYAGYCEEGLPFNMIATDEGTREPLWVKLSPERVRRGREEEGAAPDRPPEPWARRGYRPPTAMRTWTSADGEFTVEGQFRGLLGGKVRIKKPDGQTISVELERLSEADRAWVEAVLGE